MCLHLDLISALWKLLRTCNRDEKQNSNNRDADEFETTKPTLPNKKCVTQ